MLCPLWVSSDRWPLGWAIDFVGHSVGRNSKGFLRYDSFLNRCAYGTPTHTIGRGISFYFGV